MLDFVFGLVGTLLYPLFSVIFVFINVLQSIFYSLAGVQGGYIKFTGASVDGSGNVISSGEADIGAGNSGAVNDNGLIFFLLNTPIVKNLLISITTLAIFLLIIFTVMAFIKNAYSAKQKTWQEIIGNSLKGLLNFVFVPVCCLLGIWVSNIVLNAINSATSAGGAKDMSRKLFLTCAYNANQYRNANQGTADEAYESVKATIEYYGLTNEIPIESGQSLDYYADKVDELYSHGNGPFLGSHNSVGVGVDFGNGYRGYYNLYQINYLTLVVGGVFMLYVLVSLAYAMVRRIFILIMLFVISPALCAMYPLDEGNAVGQWKKNFIATTIGAYGAVAGMNIFFSILPLIDKINFFEWNSRGGSNDIDFILQLLMLVCGLFVVKEMMQMISGYIGGDDAFAKGTSLRQSTKKAVKQYGGKAISGAFKYGSKAISSWKDARTAREEGGKGKGRIGAFGSAVGGMVASIGGDLVKASGASETIKSVRDGIKEGKGEVKDAQMMRALVNDLKAALGVTEKDGTTYTARGYKGKWNANASLTDLLKIADGMGLKEIGAKGAKVNLEQLKLDTESITTFADAAKALHKVSESIQSFVKDNKAVMGGMNLDTFAKQKIKTEAEAGPGGLTAAEKERNAAIKEAQSLISQREEGMESITKASGDAFRGVQTNALKNIVQTMNTNVEGLESVKSDNNAFAEKVAEIKAQATNGKIEYTRLDKNSHGEDVAVAVSRSAGISIKESMNGINEAIATALTKELGPVQQYLRKLVESDKKDKK